MKTTQRPDNHEALAALFDTWLQRAKAKFQSARQEPDEKGRLQIEHGATCYFNCAQELLQLLQAGDMPADPGVRKSVTGRKGDDQQAINPRIADMNQPGIAWYNTAEPRIEAAYTTRGAELQIAFSEGLPNGYEDFWIPFSAPTGQALGWVKFCYVTTTQQKALFAATEWRSASEPAPALQDRLELPLAPLLEGFSPER